LQIQRDLGRSYALILAYNGNHGIKIPYSNTWGNAYDPEAFGLPGALYPTVGAIAQGAPPNPSYGTVTEVQSGGVSNYNGATVTVRKRLSRGLTFDLNYTWSHGLDDVSNGGVFPSIPIPPSGRRSVRTGCGRGITATPITTSGTA
jgi:hypothetical protein